MCIKDGKKEDAGGIKTFNRPENREMGIFSFGDEFLIPAYLQPQVIFLHVVCSGLTNARSDREIFSLARMKKNLEKMKNLHSMLAFQ